MQAGPWVLWVGLIFHGPRPDREIHGLGVLVHGLKNLGPHRFVTDFHNLESVSSDSWPYGPT